MEVIVGKYSGFCAGVNYTYSKALEELEKGQLYCLGKIIHNEHVIKELEDKGMITVDKLTDIPDHSSVIFRAHGEPLSSYTYAKEHNINIIDLTCGKVKAIHNKVEKMKEDNYIVIIGKKTHPEIIGTVGFAGNNYSVIEDVNDIKNLRKSIISSKKNKVFIISQTTFSNKLFDDLIEEIKKELNDIELTIDKSICNATEKRQLECEEISKNVDLMIVIGSQNSSNTRELYNIAIKNCKNVIFAENVDSINNISFNYEKIGVVAGASAPRNLIDIIVLNIK